jgi:hypothetical protein
MSEANCRRSLGSYDRTLSLNRPDSALIAVTPGISVRTAAVNMARGIPSSHHGRFRQNPIQVVLAGESSTISTFWTIDWTIKTDDSLKTARHCRTYHLHELGKIANFVVNNFNRLKDNNIAT